MAVHQNFNVGLNASDYYREQARLVSSGTRASRELANQWNNVRRGMAAPARGIGGNGSGGLAVQIQDIAVQLQSGTKFATILAQQGSQMASVFGPSGAVFGGLIAIVGLIASLSSAQEKFLKTGMEIRQNLKDQSMDAGGLVAALKAASDHAKELEESMKPSFGSSFVQGLRGAYQGLTGGASLSGERTGQRLDYLATQKARIQGEQDLVSIAEQELEVQKLITAGKVHDADRLKLELDYRRELVKIDAMRTLKGGMTKDNLRDIATQTFMQKVTLENQKEENEVREKKKRKMEEILTLGEREKALWTEIFDINRTEDQKLARLVDVRQSAIRTASKDPLVMAKARVTAAEAEIKIQGILKAQREKAHVDEERREKEELAATEKRLENEKKMRELRAEAIGEAERRQREVDYTKGDLINDRASEILTPAAQRAQVKHDEAARKRAVRRAAEEQVDKDDREARKNDRGGGLSPAEKRRRRDELIRKAEEARKKNQIEAKFSPDQITLIVKQIAELQAK